MSPMTKLREADRFPPDPRPTSFPRTQRCRPSCRKRPVGAAAATSGSRRLRRSFGEGPAGADVMLWARLPVTSKIERGTPLSVRPVSCSTRQCGGRDRPRPGVCDQFGQALQVRSDRAGPEGCTRSPKRGGAGCQPVVAGGDPADQAASDRSARRHGCAGASRPGVPGDPAARKADAHRLGPKQSSPRCIRPPCCEPRMASASEHGRSSLLI